MVERFSKFIIVRYLTTAVSALLLKAEKLNPGSAPVGVKPSIKQANASHPTTRYHVSGANSQASGGLVTPLGRVVCKPDRLNL